MKKVKTLFAIIALMLVSFVAPACNCAGGDPSEEPIVQVPAESITIRLVEETSDRAVKVVETPGDTSGKLYIQCEEGNEFTLEYTIGPSTVTKTKVNWAFSEQGVVHPYLNEGYTRTASAVEKIKFQATDTIVGDNNITELSFSTTEYERVAYCIIEVKVPAIERSTLLTPKNLKFDPTNRLVTWDAVTQMKNLKDKNVNIAGNELQSYEITSYEARYNADLGKNEYVAISKNTVAPDKTYFEPEDGFDAGKQYAFSVKAVGNPSLVNDSASTDIYKFYQLNSATNISHNNGKLTLTPLDYTEDIRVYLDGNAKNATKPNINANETVTLDHKGFNASSSLVYNVQLMSYPCDFALYNSATGHAIASEFDENDLTYYFPSELTETITIYKLKAPTSIAIAQDTDRVTSLSSNFLLKGSNYIEISDGASNNPSGVGVRYAYEVFAGSTSKGSGTTNTSKISLESLNLSSGSYRMKVWTEGNTANTIDSISSGHDNNQDKMYKEITFNILPETITPRLTTISEGGSGDTLKVQLKTSPAGFVAGGFELLFIDESNPANSIKKVVSLSTASADATIDLIAFGLQTGTYKVYARPLASGSNISVLPATDSGFTNMGDAYTPYTLIVPEVPSGMVVSPDGNLTFKKIDNSDVFEVSIRRKKDGEDRTDKVYIYNTSNLTQADRNDLADYTVSGEKINISLTEIHKHIQFAETAANLRNYNNYFLAGYTFSLQIRTCGNIESDTTSSKNSDMVEFGVNSAPTSVLLNNYTLALSGMSGTPYKYTIKAYDIDQEGNVTDILLASADAGQSTSINLNDLKVEGGDKFVDKIISELTIPNSTEGDNFDGKVWLEIVAVGTDATPATENSKLSATTGISFQITNRVANLALNQEGLLTWKSPITNPTTYDYVVRFYSVNGDTLTELEQVNVKVITREEVSGDQTINVPVFAYNVKSVLDKYAGQTVAISVQETNPGQFWNEESAYLYATTTAAPTNLKWSEMELTGTHNVVEWDGVAGATYYVSVSGAKTINPVETDVNYYSITDKINDKDAPWGVGTYTISVSKNMANGDGTKDSPIALQSLPTTINITLVNSAINVNANDYALEWLNPTYESGLNTNYLITATYGEEKTHALITTTDQGVKLGDGVVIEYASDAELSNKIVLDTTQKLTLATDYTVVVTPSISFVGTGYIYIGSTSENTIVKYSTPTVVTNDGGLLITVNQILTDGNYELILMDGANPVKTQNYRSDKSEDKENGVTTFEITFNDKEAAKEHSYTATIKAIAGADGTRKTLSGESSATCSAYKLEKTSGVEIKEKDGKRYLTWKGQAGVSYYDIEYYYGTDSEQILPMPLRVEFIDNGDDPFGYDAVFPNPDPDATDDNLELINSEYFKYIGADNTFYLLFDESVFVNGKVGDITFTVRATTTIDGYLHGNVSDEKVVTKLNSSETQITTDGGLVYISDYIPAGVKDEADFAAPLSYEILVSPVVLGADNKPLKIKENGVDITVTAVDKTYAPAAIDKPLEIVDINSLRFQLSNNGYFNFSTPSGSELTIEGTKHTIAGYLVELIFKGNSTNLITSEPASKVVGKLAATAQIKTVDGVLGWAEVEGADEYSLYVKEDSPTAEAYTFNVGNNTTLSADVSLTLPGSKEDNNASTTSINESNEFTFDAGKTYIVKVKAGGKDMVSSDWSETFTIHKLKAPTNVKIVSDRDYGTPNLTWVNENSVAVAYQPTYVIDYMRAGASIATTELPNQASLITTPIDMTDKTAGECAFKMKIIGNTTSTADANAIGYLCSEYSVIDEACTTQFIDGIDVLAFNGTELNKNTLSWSSWASTNLAYSYKITIYEIEIKEETVTEKFVAELRHSATEINLVETGYILAGKTYKVYVEAITNPSTAIITANSIEISTVVARPEQITTLKVKDGMLYWEVNKTSIENFITTQNYVYSNKITATADDIITSLNTYINNPSGTYAQNGNFGYLTEINITANGHTETKKPLKSEIVYEAGSTTKIAGLGYYYSFSREPEIDTNNIDSGKYTIKVATPSNPNNSIAVITGINSGELVAYKPVTPKTWTNYGSDIYAGRAQWELSTTIDSTMNKFGYYQDYELVAVQSDGATLARKVINTQDVLDDTEYASLSQNYLYSMDIKEGLFYTEEMLPGVEVEELEKRTDLLVTNNDYTLYVRAIGTKDSEADGFTGPIYLNSSYSQFNEVLNILDVTQNYQIAQNKLTWETEYGSTGTKVFVYGPYDNLSNANLLSASINDNWYTYDISEEIKDIEEAYLASPTTYTHANLHVFEYNTTKNEETGNNERTKDFSLTGLKIPNSDDYFLPGGYVIRLQELGDNKGIISSSITTDIVCSKLGYGVNNPISMGSTDYDMTRIMQATGYVGVYSNSCKIYQVNEVSGEWEVKSTTKNQTTGEFVWNPVAGANQYMIDVYCLAKDSDDGVGTKVNKDPFYTRETTFVMPDYSDYNLPAQKYYLRITPQRSSSIDNNKELAANFFYADYKDTTAHERLAVPSKLELKGAGILYCHVDPNYSTGYKGTTATSIYDKFRVKFNEGEEDDTVFTSQPDTSNQAQLDFSSQTAGSTMGEVQAGTTGTIGIQVKTYARDGAITVKYADESSHEKIFLNSGYTPIVRVSKLADPNARFVNGEFNWSGDHSPYTTTSLQINDGEVQTIGTYTDGTVNDYDQWIRYFTDITAHNSDDYTAEEDEEIYTVDTHKFKVKYDGSVGTVTGTSESFYITSEFVEVTATKLKAPEPIKGNTSTGNILKWKHDAHAEGYRIRMFTDDMASGEYLEIQALYRKIVTGGYEDLSKLTEGETEYIVLNMTKSIEQLKIGSEGGNIYVYVQAIGTGMNINGETSGTTPTSYYLSSSYSTPTTFGVPSTVQNVQISSTTGAISWKEIEEDYYIKLKLTYEVANLSTEMFMTWAGSADGNKYYNATGTSSTRVNDTRYYFDGDRYPEIKTRKVTLLENDGDEYKIQVEDEIILNPKNGKAASSYNLTAIATYTQIEIYVLTFNPDEVSTTDQTFISNPYIYDDNNGFTFNMYESGEGTTYNKYVLSSSAHLLAIANNIDRHYQLAGNIDMTGTTWKTIAPMTKDENHNNIVVPFTGTIDGKGYSLMNYRVSGTAISTLNNSTSLAFVYELGEGAKIENLTFQIAEGGMSNSGSSSVVTGVVAVNNRGLISNVTTKGDMVMSTGGANGTAQIVAGIAVSNYGTIKFVKVHGNITSMANGGDSTKASAIAGYNYNIISDACYCGLTTGITMKANQIGGLVYENYGSINRSYVGENVTLYGVDVKKDGTNSGRQVVLGGVVGLLKQRKMDTGILLGHEIATITNTYSRAKIVYSTTNGETHAVSGFAASVTTSFTNISNCYAIVDIMAESNSSTTVYNFVGNSGLGANALSNNYYIVVSSVDEADNLTYAGRLEKLAYEFSDATTDDLSDKLVYSGSEYEVVDGKVVLKSKTITN